MFTFIVVPDEICRRSTFTLDIFYSRLFLSTLYLLEKLLLF